MTERRIRYYDLVPGLPPLNFVLHAQRARVETWLASREGQWILTIRGHRPAQIVLDEPPVMPPKAESSRD